MSRFGAWLPVSVLHECGLVCVVDDGRPRVGDAAARPHGPVCDRLINWVCAQPRQHVRHVHRFDRRRYGVVEVRAGDPCGACAGGIVDGAPDGWLVLRRPRRAQVERNDWCWRPVECMGELAREVRYWLGVVFEDDEPLLVAAGEVEECSPDSAVVGVAAERAVVDG